MDHQELQSMQLSIPWHERIIAILFMLLLLFASFQGIRALAKVEDSDSEIIANKF